MKFVIDIEASDLLQNALDYTSLPYKLKPEFRIWCIVVTNQETKESVSLYQESLTKENLRKALVDCTELIGHNIIGYDLPVLYLYGLLDYTVGYPEQSSKVFDKDTLITDTLLWSKLLEPDRFLGHSLKAWGKRLGNDKIEFDDWSQFSQEQLEYCIQDTLVNCEVYDALVLEKATADWDRAYSMESKLADLTLKQELLGFEFNLELAQKTLDELDALMLETANKVNPLLPPKRLTKGKIQEFMMPKLKFKKDGTLSAVFVKWLAKHQAEFVLDSLDNNDYILYKGNKFYIKDELPLETTEVATVDDVDVVKGYLLNLGWIPSEIKERNLTINADKTKREYKAIVKAIDAYVEQTRDSVFRDLRLEALNTDMKSLRNLLLGKIDGSKPMYVPTTPMLRVGVEKELCPNLIRLGSKAEVAKIVAEYYTYRHRRNSIAGGTLDEDGEPITGYMSQVRADGRIATPADTLGANTGRYKHKGVCNVPRTTSLFGEKMRSLFGSGKGLHQLGYDFASLEARIMGHYVLPYDGEELAQALLASKPRDVHCYRSDSEILTKEGWKLFSDITYDTLVLQHHPDGTSDWVKPLAIIWEDYKGTLYECDKTHLSVTPNHRLIYKSYSDGCYTIREVLAKDLVASSDKRHILGTTIKQEGLDISDDFLRLLVATQADGYMSKDSSSIQFSFVKERKVERLKQILDKLGIRYSRSKHFRKERYEHTFRLNASPDTVRIRELLPNKQFDYKFLSLNERQINIVLDEIFHWDGTITNKGAIVLDTTDKQTVQVLQTLAIMVNRKAFYHEYLKNNSFTGGKILIYRLLISTKLQAYAGVKDLKQVQYEGKIGCVTVPSGMIVVRRKNVALVSGNSINAKKLGIDRGSAKSFSYACIYGAQPKKLAKMLGITETKAKELFNAYWEAVLPLKQLKLQLEKAWEARGKKFIKGIDGRLLHTRSKHSLINVLFQSGGAISVKWSLVRLAQYLEELDMLGNPFENTKQEMKVWFLIAYHDEAQLALNPKLIDVKLYGTEDEAKANLVEGSSAIGHSHKGYYVAYKTQVVDCIERSIKKAQEELNLRVELGFEWIVGRNWGQCH